MNSNNELVQRITLLVWLGIAGMLALAALPENYSVALVCFLVLAVFVQATLFTLPLGLLELLRRSLPTRLRNLAALDVAHTLLALSLTGFVAANLKLYDLYGFHANYFVWNLVTTPGGIEAMGVNHSTRATLGAAVTTIPPVFYVTVKRFAITIPRFFLVSKGRLALALALCFVSESMIYAYADYNGDTAVTSVAQKIVWYMPVTAKSAFTSLGLPRREGGSLSIDAAGGKLNYPAISPVSNHASRPAQRYNIVWLVAESWRADAVDPQTMPATYKFANENLWFRQHYSGGNGTRMGMFTQFYGLYGSYWFDILQVGTPPALMQYLQAQGYDFQAFTSSAFTYPEFDKTIFSTLPPDSLHAYSEGYGWERDRKNTTALVRYIEEAESPFFAFMFFESSHANYYFPTEDAIYADYLEDFNYLTTDISEKIGLIYNRYRNATHHLDSQLARVYSALEAQGRLDSTIVIVTGDHGEEFMENGRWGHNSTFSQQQIRVPLVLHLPGADSGRIDSMTSHLDLPATILAAVNANIPAEELSYGRNLLDPSFKRDFTVVSDWHGNTLVTPDVKITFSLKGAAKYAAVTDLQDHPLDFRSPFDSTVFSDELAAFTQSLNRFYR